MESHPSQPPPHPEREILGKKIDEGAETFDNKILNISNHFLISNSEFQAEVPIPKSSIPNLKFLIPPHPGREGLHRSASQGYPL
jgi:hypothetical protein